MNFQGNSAGYSFALSSNPLRTHSHCYRSQLLPLETFDLEDDADFQIKHGFEH